MIPKFLLDKIPPVIARDPKPMAGLIEFMSAGLHGPVWKERFLVSSKAMLKWYPPTCAIEGYVETQALGSIPIENIFEAQIDGDQFELQLKTERCTYHFRSRQHG